ncbi:MAG: hypothetical protein ACF8QF_06055, partial [Phycisphaerales bacterium]
MSDERPREDAPQDEGDHIPVEPAKRDPKAKITRQSLLDLGKDEPDRCPSCAAELPDKNATLCLQCGYDLKANKKLRTKVGAEEVEEAPGDFSQAGVIPWQATLGLGMAAIVGAAALAFTNSDASALRESLRVAVHALVHVGLGVVAAIVTALFLQQKFGKVEFAVGRMALAVGLFFLSLQVGVLLGGGPTAQWIVGAGLGAACYYLVVWRMFRTT